MTVEQMIALTFGAINAAGLQPLIIAAAVVVLAIAAVKALSSLKD